MHPNEELLTGFYSAFAAKDHATMGRAYADGATFTDPVFGRLETDEVRAMWRMFCTSGNDIDLTFGDVRADDSRGSAKWEAIYRFPPTKRRVHNKISGSFEFRDGLIWSHVDDFDLYRWTRMALGPMGTALGWSPMVKGKVRKGAQAQLGAFMAGERKTPAS